MIDFTPVLFGLSLKHDMFHTQPELVMHPYVAAVLTCGGGSELREYMLLRGIQIREDKTLPASLVEYSYYDTESGTEHKSHVRVPFTLGTIQTVNELLQTQSFLKTTDSMTLQDFRAVAWAPVLQERRKLEQFLRTLRTYVDEYDASISLPIEERGRELLRNIGESAGGNERMYFYRTASDFATYEALPEHVKQTVRTPRRSGVVQYILEHDSVTVLPAALPQKAQHEVLDTNRIFTTAVRAWMSDYIDQRIFLTVLNFLVR